MDIKDLFKSSRERILNLSKSSQGSQVTPLGPDDSQETPNKITYVTSSLPSQRSRGISDEDAKSLLLKIKNASQGDPNNLFSRINIDD